MKRRSTWWDDQPEMIKPWQTIPQTFNITVNSRKEKPMMIEPMVDVFTHDIYNYIYIYRMRPQKHSPSKKIGQEKHQQSGQIIVFNLSNLEKKNESSHFGLIPLINTRNQPSNSSPKLACHFSSSSPKALICLRKLELKARLYLPRCAQEMARKKLPSAPGSMEDSLVQFLRGSRISGPGSLGFWLVKKRSKIRRGGPDFQGKR